jgi:hypothetical protein
VPEVQNFNEVRRFVDAVINQYWRVNQLADAGATNHWGPNVRKTLEKIDVIEDCGTESLSILGKPRPGVAKDFLKIR